MNAALHPAIPMMAMFYSVSIYRRFDELGEAKAKEIADAAQEFSLRAPLLDGGKERYTLPYHAKEVMPGYVATVMAAYLVWTLDGQNLPDSPLLSAAATGYKLHQAETAKR